MEDIRIRNLDEMCKELNELSKNIKQTKETVTISLERYNEYLRNKSKLEKIYEEIKPLQRLIEQPNFNIKDCFHEELYKLYEKIILN